MSVTNLVNKLFGDLKIQNISYSFHIISFSYFIFLILENYFQFLYWKSGGWASILKKYISYHKGKSF